MRHQEWRVIPCHVILSQATRVFQVSSFVALLSQPLKIGWIGVWFNFTIPELWLTYTRMKALGYPQLPRVNLLMVHLAFPGCFSEKKTLAVSFALSFYRHAPYKLETGGLCFCPLFRERERHVLCSNSGKKTSKKKITFFLILLTLLLFLHNFQEILIEKDNPEGNSNNPF